jgi:hypothetical protein
MGRFPEFGHGTETSAITAPPTDACPDGHQPGRDDVFPLRSANGFEVERSTGQAERLAAPEVGGENGTNSGTG